MQRHLFPPSSTPSPSPDPTAAAPSTDAPASGGPAPRVARANRSAIRLEVVSLDARLPADHMARVVVGFVSRLDLSALYAKIRSVEGGAGRPAVDPQILLSLWLYATLDGVGSAREIARLTEVHDAYRWICGEVGVNYHLLSDFRADSGDTFDQLLTRNVASLLSTGLVTMQRVAQDGMRVRAWAGAGSFRRRDTLERCVDAAKQQVERLRKEAETDPSAASRREHAKETRVANERARRLDAALAEMPKVEAAQARRRARAKRKKDRPAEPRVSTTDPESRVMKMANGGFRPAFNVQFATDTATQVVVGVEVDNRGSDVGQLVPMLEQLQRRYGRMPAEALVDGGYGKLEAVEQVPNGCTVYTPLPPARDATRDPHAPLPGDSPKIAAWRARMGTEPAKAIYRERAAVAECVNAQARNRGLRQFRTCGQARARATALLYALAHNVMRVHTLTQAAKA